MQILQEQKLKNETQHNKVPGNRKRISPNPLNGRGTGRKIAAGQKGFTLPELLLVVGILVILAAVSIPAIIKHRDNLRQTELDEKARAVFIAAQNRLSEMKTMGTVIDISDSYYGGHISDIPNDNTFSISTGKAPDASLKVTSSSTSNFMDNTIYSSSALSGGENYVIEYDSENYAVYAAWYWETTGSFMQKASAFAYPENFNSYTKGSEKVEDLRTSKEHRKLPSVGYYGGAAVTSNKEEVKTMDFKLSVENGPELKLVISAPDSAADEDSFMHQTVFSVRVASDYGAVKEYSFKPAFTNKSGEYTANDLQITPGNVALISAYNGGSWNIVLDSLEANKHFANLFPGITAGSDVRITVTASSTSTTELYNPITKMVTVNSLFASLLNDGKKAEIANGRHLQNLSPNTSHFGYYSNGNNETKDNKLNIKDARMTQGIDWKESYTPVGSDTVKTYDDVSTLYSDSTGIQVHFYPIGNTCGQTEDTGFRTFNGNNEAVRNLHVTTNETEVWGESGEKKIYGYAGLFGYLAGTGSSDKVIIKNLSLINPAIVNPAAFIGVTQTGDSYAGSLAGYLKYAETTNCYTYLVDSNSGDDMAAQAQYLSDLYESLNGFSSGVIAENSTYAGGMIGKANNLTAENCLAAVKVKGSSYAGGLIGEILGTESSSVTSCCAGGHIEKGVYSTSSYNIGASGIAGGFIGVSKGTVTIGKSFTTCSVDAKAAMGPFTGDTSTGLTAADVYGIGATGTTATANSLYATGADRGTDDAQLSAENTHSYDATLHGDGSSTATSQKAYPYKSWQSFFYGDWTVTSTITSGFVYYEEYIGGKFGFWSADQSDPNAYNSLSNTDTIISDGYGYITSDIKDKVSVGTFSLSGIPIVNPNNNAAGALFCFPWEVTHKRFQSFNGALYYSNNSFYDNEEISVNNGSKYTVYYNPHFAKAIALNKEIAASNPENAIIRTARHLYELGSKDNAIYAPLMDYWNDKCTWNYIQERDIDCSSYNGDTYGTIGDISQGTIGFDNRDHIFKRIYDGGKYKISNLSMPYDPNVYGVYGVYALFGYNAGTIKNVVLEKVTSGSWYSSPASGLAYQNMSGGLIDNCKIVDSTILSYSAVFGFVYENDASITNCSMENITLTTTLGIAAGIAVQSVKGIISDSTLTGCTIISNYRQASGIVDYNNGNCSVTGCSLSNSTIQGYTSASGLVGKNETSTIKNCSLDNTNVTSTDGDASGLFDSNNGGNIVSACSITGGTVSGLRIASGAIRDNNSISVTECTLTDVTVTSTNGYAVGFVYTNKGEIIDGCNVLRPEIMGKTYAIGMVGVNTGNVKNCYLISPKISSNGLSAGFSYTSTSDIENCQIYPQRPDTGLYLNQYDANGNEIGNNYTNAVIVGKWAYGFIYEPQGGTVKNCSVTASVISGDAYVSDNKITGATAVPYINGLASGFVGIGSGNISQCYANCYTVGYDAVGFEDNTWSSVTIKNCYSLGQVNSISNKGTCAGFTLSRNWNCSYCYTAASVRYSNSYTMTVAGTVQSESNKSKIESRFGPTAAENHNYYLDWNGYADVSNATNEIADSISFANLMDTLGDLKPESADANPFDTKLESYDKYPFAGTPDLTMYGDWPLDSSFGARLAYFEIYDDNSVGINIRYMLEGQEVEWSSLDNTKAIILDGYGVLFNRAYAESDDQSSDFKSLFNSGSAGKGSTAYVSWKQKTNSGADNSTNSATADDSLIIPANIASGIDDEVSISDTKSINGEYVLRILPYNAVVAGEQLYSTGYQHIAIVDGNNTRDYYYMPQFAKSIILTEEPADASRTLYIRTQRQLVTMGLQYGSSSYDSTGKFKYTYIQEMPIDLSEGSSYSTTYGNVAIDSKYRSAQLSIGASDKPFIDIYDGKEKTITNLSKPVFGYISGVCGGEVRNLNLTNSKIDGNSGNVGLLAGNVISSAIINNCSAGTDTSVTGKGAVNVGGLIGFLSSGTVKNCDSGAEITISSSPSAQSVSAGGFIGKVSVPATVSNNTAEINACTATGDVTVQGTVIDTGNLTAYVPAEGGFAGCIEAATTGTISGTASVLYCSSKGNVVSPLTTATVNGVEDQTIAAPVDAGGFVGKEENVRKNIVLKNLWDLCNGEQSTIYNRAAVSQNDLTIINFIKNKNNQIDSNAFGYSQRDPTKQSINYGPVTDDVIGSPGFNAYLKKKSYTSLDGTTILKDLYNYYIFPFLTEAKKNGVVRERYQDILASAVPKSLSGAEPFGENSYLKTVYQYIDQDKIFTLWMLKHVKGGEPYLYWINGDTDSTDTSSGYSGYQIKLSDWENNRYGAADPVTLKQEIIKTDRAFYQYDDKTGKWIQYNYNIIAYESNPTTRKIGKCIFTGCTYIRNATKNASFMDAQTYGMDIKAVAE